MKSTPKQKSTNYQVCYSPKKVNSTRSKSINSIKVSKTKRITPYRECDPPQPIPSYIKHANQKNNSNNNNSQSTTPLINDSYCIDLRDQLMNDGIMIEDIEYNDLPNLSEHLREYTASKSFERDYTTAKKSKELYDQIKEKMNFQNTYYDKSKNDNEDQNEHLIEEKINDQKTELEKFDEETEEKLRNLQKKHEEKTENFEKKWSEELPQSYRKQSSKLIQLFEIEKTLGLLNEFDKANQIKDEANKLEETEMQAAQRQMENDYENQKLTFENSYAKEVRNIEETRKAQRDCIIARHKAELKTVKNRINVLNDHQRQIKRPKESSIEIQSRPQVNSNLINIIRGVSRPGTASSNASSKSKSSSNIRSYSKSQTSKLLPPLIPPNDARVKERKKKERKDRIEKNKKFRERMIAKEREEEERYNESIAMSPRNEENCFDNMLKQLDNLTSKDNNHKNTQDDVQINTQDDNQKDTQDDAQKEELVDVTEKDTYNGNEATELITSMIEKIDTSDKIQPHVTASEDLNDTEIKKEKNENPSVQIINPETFNLTQSPQFQTQKD